MCAKAACALGVVLWAGCAVPVPPTGGPPDTTPPAVVRTFPENNAVEFSDDAITIEFTEKVDQASFARSLSVTPELALPPQIKWSGRTAEVVFREPLRENTTYIVTLDNVLHDNRGVKLKRPISLAFSTGQEIDVARIEGRVLFSKTGQPWGGVTVLAYAWPDSVETPDLNGLPPYHTQSAVDGTFAFGNLPERPFFVIGVDDRNRNRKPDSTEIVALPYPGHVRATKEDPVPSAVLFQVPSDTTGPSLIQTRSLSSRRIELRYDEPVVLTDPSADNWMISDTLSGLRFATRTVFQSRSSLNRITVTTDSLAAGIYWIRPPLVIADTAGNLADRDPGMFVPTARADTARLRFMGFKNATAAGATVDLGPGVDPGFELSESTGVADLTEVVHATVMGRDRAVALTTANGTAWATTFDPVLVPGDTVEIAVAGALFHADTLYSISYRYPSNGETGTVVGIAMTGRFAASNVHVELVPDDAMRTRIDTDTDEDGAFAFRSLLTGGYRLRAFVDQNRNGLWDGGGLTPWELPEPIMWYPDSLQIRQGWETVIDTLRFVDE